MPARQSTNWMFTLNNPKDFKPEVEWVDIFKYLIYQQEEGKEGTLHLQGYVQFKKRHTLAGLKKVNAAMHWEIRKGSHDQAKAYCSKSDTRKAGPFEFGVEPAQGNRSDLDAVKQSIDDGLSMAEIADKHFTSFIKYERGLRSYKNMKTVPRSKKTKIVVCYGPTGTGKSHFCREQAGPGAYWYIPQSDGKWWDGYTDQKTIIIDEFYGQIRYSTALRLFDRYPCTVEMKGATVNFAPDVIYITSNKAPVDWYPNNYSGFSALNRRLDEILYFPVLGEIISEKLPTPPPLPSDEYLRNPLPLPIPLPLWEQDEEAPKPVEIIKTNSGFTLACNENNNSTQELVNYRHRPDFFSPPAPKRRKLTRRNAIVIPEPINWINHSPNDSD